MPASHDAGSSPDRYLEPYRRSVLRHGSGFRATLWASPESQHRRFEVFTEMCFLAGKRVLDAGCSRGDLAAYFVQRRIAFESYTGVDALPDVIDFACGRGLPKCTFLCGDFLTNPGLLATGDPQVICISGSLNTMSDEQARQVLEQAWLATGQTLLFNFLSDRAGHGAPPQDSFARRLNTMAMLDWALSRTCYTAFRQDYFPEGHDATVMMIKSRGG